MVVPATEDQDKLLRCLVNSTEDIVRVLDIEGRVTFVNPKGLAVMGLTDLACLRGAYWPDLWPGDVRPDMERALAAARSGAVGRFEAPCPLDRAGERWWDTVVTPVFGDDNELVRMLAISRDISEQHRLQEALVAALAEAEAANRCRSDFFANVSHELRTPLNGIVGMGSLLEQTALTRDQRPMVEVIRESGEVLARRVEDLLDHVRIDAGRLEVISAPFHLGDALRMSAEAATAAGAGRHTDFRVEIHASADRVVVGDESRLKKIVGHLLTNALKFTDEGSVTLTAVAIEEDRYRITVTDTGIGIHPSAHEQIFRQGDARSTRVQGGLGLGLALSRQLADLLGAELDCESAPDEGATFALTVPLGRPATAASPDQAPYSVLIVDDHAANRQILQLVLAQAGAEAMTAENGAEACALFKKARFDLVVMDIQMPVMDGLAAIRRLRSLEAAQQRPRTPVIVITANATDENRKACNAADIDGFLTKPLQPVVLLSAFRTLLAGGRTPVRAVAPS